MTGHERPGSIRISDELTERMRSAACVCALTGAGVSVESGLATFRNPGGHWDRYRPEDLATEQAFRRNPQLVQDWYAARRKRAMEAEPNEAHRALASLERLVEHFLLITQNVDGLHERAGSRRMVEVHGNIMRAYCIDCGERAEPRSDGADGLQTCASCGSPVRPDVVWFGEQLPDDAFRRAVETASRADVFLSVGTSTVVYPAAGLPLIARENGAYVVEINVEPSALSHVMHEVLLGPASSVLPPIVSIRATSDRQAPTNGSRTSMTLSDEPAG